MRRVSIWLISTIAIVVLLFSYKTSTSGPDQVAQNDGGQPPGVVTGPDAGGATAKPAPGKSGSGASGNSGTSGTAAKHETVNGAVADTRWGPVQVQVHITGSKITDVKAVEYPSGNGHDQAINSYALPRLRQQVLSAQSASISGVSGATVTSDGYRESLQSALDAAHFGA